MKKGLNLEEAFKALNGRLPVKEGVGRTLKGRSLKEKLAKASAEWLRALDKIKTNKITRVDLDDQDTLIFKVERDKVLVMLADDPDDVETFPLTTFVEDFIDYYLISSDGFETFEKIAAIDEKEYRRLIGKEVSQKWLRALNRIKRNAFSKVELDDQDALLFKVERDKVFVQLFDSQTEKEFPLTTFVEDFIDYYLISSDGFETFERIKIISKEEYEELADPNPGHYDDHGKWVAPNGRSSVTEDVFEKDNLRKYTAAVREIKNDPTKKIVLDYGELQDPRFLSITFENGKLVIDDEEEKYDLDPEVMKDWMNFDSIKVF